MMISAAVAGIGFMVIQAGKAESERAAKRAENQKLIEAMERDNRAFMEEAERDSLAREEALRLENTVLQKKLEEEDKEEAARLRAEQLRLEEDERIRNKAEKYPVEQMLLTYTSAPYTQAGRTAAKAQEAYDSLSADIEEETKTMAISVSLASTLFAIWLVTVAANVVMASLVLWSIMGYLAFLAAPALVLAPSAVMCWIRNSVDRCKRERIQREVMLRTFVAGAAVLVLVGGVLISSADSRASYVYDSKINIAQLRLDQLKERMNDQLSHEYETTEFEVKLQESVLEELQKNKEKTAQTFKGLLPICLALECLGAYYISEIMTRKRISALEQDRIKARAVKKNAEESQQEMAMNARNNIIQRMIGLDLYSDDLLARLGLNEENPNGEDPEDDRDSDADNDQGIAAEDEKSYTAPTIDMLGVAEEEEENPFSGWETKAPRAEKKFRPRRAKTPRQEDPGKSLIRAQELSMSAPEESEDVSDNTKDFFVD